MMKQAIEKIINRENLTYQEAYTVMNKILDGKTGEIQTAAFLSALSAKTAGTEAIDEITGCAQAMREHEIRVDYPADVMEIAGTGGDGSSSFNISTTSAFVVASAGVRVAKHGDRAASSQSGTADCLEALGANINLDPEQCIKLLDEVGFCFFYAPKYQPSMEHVNSVRKELGMRTVFNILGSMTNPANPTHYLLGVYDEYLVELLARVLIHLGVKKGLVVYGQDRLDEVSLSAPTTVCEIKDGYYKNYVIKPEDFGFQRSSKEELTGGTPEVNASITRSILDGTEQGAKRSTVLLNAGAALYAAGAVSSIREGIQKAEECLDSREALHRLEAFIEISNR